MAQGVEPGDVGQGADPRRRRGGPLPVVALVIVVLVILWLLWQFLANFPVRSEITEVTSTSTIDVTIPVAPEPDIPPAQAASTETVATDPTVPDVVGDPQASASMTLENSGYVVSPTYVYSDSTPAGLVIDQNPSGGNTLRAGGVVGIIVSRGTADTPMVVMPNVIGMTKSAAEARVRAAGLKPYILHGTDQTYAGLVGNQWPLGGSKLPKGSEGFIQVMIKR